MKAIKLVFCCLALICIISAGKRKLVEINAKYIDKRISHIDSNLYACKFECTNYEYNVFLSELNKQDLYLFKQCLMDTTCWNNDTNGISYNEPMVRYYHRHPNYYDYPLVGVTWKGAENFCNWLTEKYNSDPKRKFKEVLFKLPSKQEWIDAAKGGKDRAIFPWGGPYVRNSKGRYLANFRRMDETCVKKDTNGVFYLECPAHLNYYIESSNIIQDLSRTAPVTSYFPNEYGLHNMAGNVSEMLEVKGQTKGGSWNSPAYFLLIEAENEFGWNVTRGLSQVGFRYFMHVIEE